MSQSSENEHCAAQLRALGEPIRLRIIKSLQAGELTVSDLSELLELEIATTSHHLQALKTSGLAVARREGKYTYYSLDPTVHSRRPRTGESSFDLGCCRFVLPTDDSSK